MSADPLAEAREALESGAVEPEFVVEEYGPALREAGKLDEFADLLAPRNRRVLRTWRREHGENGSKPSDPWGAQPSQPLSELYGTLDGAGIDYDLRPYRLAGGSRSSRAVRSPGSPPGRPSTPTRRRRVGPL